MAKSRCKLCGKELKSGEWQLRATDNGVIKVCNDRETCQARIREHTFRLSATNFKKR